MEPQCATITIRRSDLPGWLPAICGEVFLDNRRVARLIGGRRSSRSLGPDPRYADGVGDPGRDDRSIDVRPGTEDDPCDGRLDPGP